MTTIKVIDLGVVKSLKSNITHKHCLANLLIIKLITGKVIALVVQKVIDLVVTLTKCF